ncbi:MAG: sensory histidine kinase AtoS [Smithella sp. PtaU1.Bin162]|nr:MAG: sensory histidine kinase AtoS [Smithella sp. PtaU1.Bin162]
MEESKTNCQKRDNELQESKELYTKLVNTIPDVIVRTDLEGKILFVNDHTLQISDYSRAELEGRNMLMFIAPEEWDRVVQNTLLMMERRLGPREYLMTMKDGRKIPFEVNGDVLRSEDGTPFGLVFVCRDITDRKLAEETIHKSYALLQSVVESSKEIVIFALDRQYRYIAFNENHSETMKRIWGADIVLGSSMLEYIKNPEDRMKAKNNFDCALSGKSFKVSEAYGDTALERRYYEDIYNPIIDENGNVIGLTLFLTDVTDRRLAEAEREKIIAELQQALSQVKTLSGLLPICASCKKIRDDKGYWHQVELYVRDRTKAEFSHGICPDCAQRLYPEYYTKK